MSLKRAIQEGRAPIERVNLTTPPKGPKQLPLLQPNAQIAAAIMGQPRPPQAMALQLPQPKGPTAMMNPIGQAKRNPLQAMRQDKMAKVIIVDDIGVSGMESAVSLLEAADALGRLGIDKSSQVQSIFEFVASSNAATTKDLANWVGTCAGTCVRKKQAFSTTCGKNNTSIGSSISDDYVRTQKSFSSFISATIKKAQGGLTSSSGASSAMGRAPATANHSIGSGGSPSIRTPASAPGAGASMSSISPSSFQAMIPGPAARGGSMARSGATNTISRGGLGTSSTPISMTTSTPGAASSVAGTNNSMPFTMTTSQMGGPTGAASSVSNAVPMPGAGMARRQAQISSRQAATPTMPPPRGDKVMPGAAPPTGTPGFYAPSQFNPAIRARPGATYGPGGRIVQSNHIAQFFKKAFAKLSSGNPFAQGPMSAGGTGPLSMPSPTRITGVGEGMRSMPAPKPTVVPPKPPAPPAAPPTPGTPISRNPAKGMLAPQGGWNAIQRLAISNARYSPNPNLAQTLNNVSTQRWNQNSGIAP